LSKGRVFVRKLAVTLTAAVLLIPLLAIAQEDDLAQYASLDQLGNVINAFVTGEDLEGVTFDATDSASGAIVRQFQITTNLVGGPTRGKDGIDFVPVGFDSGSTTRLENLEFYFDGTIGGFGDIIPPLAPWSRIDDRIDVSALFEGWTAYGDSGPIEGPVELFPEIVTIWGVELSEPIGPTCSETRYVGRTWVSKAFDGPDPLFTAEGLMSFYGGSHQALTGMGGRLIQLQCTSQGSVTWAQRMKDDGTARPFGPTGVIALVKDQFVVFFIRVDQLDNQFDQIFYASPPDGGPVLVSEVEAQPLLLVPNPYEAYPTRISIIVDERAEADGSEGNVRQLLYEGTGSGVVRIQSPTAPCTPVDGEIFVRDLRMAAKVSGFARNSSLSGIGRMIDDALFELLIQHPGGYTESLTINTDDGSVDIETPTCSGSGTALVNGEPMGSGDAADDTEGESTAEAGGQADPETETTDGIPWGPIGVAIALLAGVTAYGSYRNRIKRNCKPEEEAYDAALDAAEQAIEARKRADAELQQATTNGAPQSEIDQARSTADQAGAAAVLAHDIMIRARSAYQDCRDAPSSPETDIPGIAAGMDQSDGADQPEAEGGGTPIPPEAPAVLKKIDETDESRECEPGETKWIEDTTLRRDFTVLAGNVIMASRMSSWNRLLGGTAGIDAEDFGNIDDDQFEDALEDFDSQGQKVRLHPKIQVRTITVGCERELRCENDTWVETGRTRRIPNINGPVTSKSVGTQTNSTQKSEIIKHVGAVKVALEELDKAKEALDDFDCD
jgi:hypothetical protein